MSLTRTLLFAVFLLAVPASAFSQDRPNILWITAEDMSANLGCFGDSFARTPHLDRLAQKSVRYTQAFASAPVCSPSRSCLISGVYATSTGTQHLRSSFPFPNEIKGFPTYLRQAGYYTTNNVKTDYNTSSKKKIVVDSWDENSRTAHWRKRAKGQAFFSVFNLMTTHQSRTSVWPFDKYEAMIQQRLSANQRSHADDVPLAPYYPDTPLVRKSMARYYDCVQAMDKEVGQILEQLKEDGLEENTIVFFYSDHGMGMPRGKRVLQDSGMHVPLIVHIPDKFKPFAQATPGTALSRLVSFVDFAPTVLSLLELQIPTYMQGEPFLGKSATAPRKYVYGARDRVDEAYDVSRSVRDARYLYIRNYKPHLSWMQPEGYSDQSGMRRELFQLARDGKMNLAQLTYASPTRSTEELYDVRADPHQINNLADSTEHLGELNRLRVEHHEWVTRTRDLGFLTEIDVWNRLKDASPWELARDDERYDLTAIVQAASFDVSRNNANDLVRLLQSRDPAIRYWGVVALHRMSRIDSGVVGQLRILLKDDLAAVRIEAAAILLRDSENVKALELLESELASSDLNSALYAARTIQLLGTKTSALRPRMQTALKLALEEESQEPLQMYIRFSLIQALEDLDRK